MATPSESRAIVQRAIDFWNRQDLDAFVECYAHDLLLHPTKWGQDVSRIDQAGHREVAEIWFRAFPDIRMETVEMVAEGDRVVARFRCTGTHDGDWLGIAPTGKKVSFEEWQILRIDDGLIVEETMLLDELALLVRLGAIDFP